ncbi:proteasome assembly chaperone 1 isoform X2 [Hetaerina americana]|uniref:proteasome assembly chaperone 1 isoform X2 n=1 Tax=Hetaerina americana TaxID=62018 RepID=UPI003A7F1273
MASYFGEVLETSSRAYNEDINDDELKGAFKSEYEISWESSHRPDEVDLCFVIAGKCSRAFSAFLRRKTSPQLIAKISQVHKRDDGEYSIVKHGKETFSCIYMLKTGVYLCEVSPDVQLTHANIFTAKMHEFLELSKEVIVLASIAAVQYLSLNTNDAPFIKGLGNSKYLTSGKELLAPKMEPPNLVTGVAAAVLMFCELKIWGN